MKIMNLARIRYSVILRLGGILVIAASHTAFAAQYTIETIADELSHPWCIAFLPDGSFLVTEKAGALKRIDPANGSSATISGVPDVYFKSQGGLFDVVLHPDFATNKTVYLSYAEGEPNANGTAVARARLEGNALAGLDVIFRVAWRKDTPVHYGGRMVFLNDRTLLLATGDGFDYREQAQDRDSQLGKTLRMNDDGTPAADNPFPESPYIWTYGHRNPQGLAVSAAGEVYLHEHGPRGGDEVNIIRPATNYGWPIITRGVDYNGAYVSPFTEFPGMAQPEHVWVPSIAPSGLTVYEGDLFPDWRGNLFVGALIDRDVRRLELDDDRVVGEEALFGELDARIRDVRTGPDGALYILTDEDPGRLVRIVPN